jgi:hypothetical protein
MGSTTYIKRRKERQMTSWEALTPEQREKYCEKDKANRRLRSQAKREDEQRRNMLADFLRAPTAREKRKVIESFAPYYFVFGTTLDPRPHQPTEENDNEI